MNRESDLAIGFAVSQRKEYFFPDAENRQLLDLRHNAGLLRALPCIERTINKLADIDGLLMRVSE